MPAQLCGPYIHDNYHEYLSHLHKLWQEIESHLVVSLMVRTVHLETPLVSFIAEMLVFRQIHTAEHFANYKARGNLAVSNTTKVPAIEKSLWTTLHRFCHHLWVYGNRGWYQHSAEAELHQNVTHFVHTCEHIDCLDCCTSLAKTRQLAMQALALTVQDDLVCLEICSKCRCRSSYDRGWQCFEVWWCSVRSLLYAVMLEDNFCLKSTTWGIATTDA